MSKHLLAAAALAASIGAVSAATPANAQTSWSFSIGTGSPGYWYDPYDRYGGYYDPYHSYYRDRAWIERRRWEQRRRWEERRRWERQRYWEQRHWQDEHRWHHRDDDDDD